MSVLDQRLPVFSIRTINQRFKTANEDWYVGSSDIQGKGVFAGRPYGVDDVIDVAMYADGEDEFGAKIWNLTTLARYCNHQEKNNVEIRKQGDVFQLVASEPIDKDEELVSNYRQVSRAAGPHNRMLWLGQDIPVTDFSDYVEKSASKKRLLYHSCCGKPSGECHGCPGNMKLVTEDELDT